MPKKIYDIKPPKIVHKIEKEKERKVPMTISKEKKIDTVRKPELSYKKEKKSAWPSILIFILVILIAIGAYLFFKLPKADITIWPKVNTLSFQQTLTADKSATSVDIAKAIIPAQYFQAIKTNSQDFPSTGNADNVGQATGTITIYNKFDPPTSFTFKSGTHFMSDSGKLFVALQKIVIPAAKKSGNKITPGSVQVSIQAVEGGTDYNIAPSNFSVPGLKGTASYYSIYATSTVAMAGGYTGNVKKVTDDDIQGAKDVLTQKTTTDAIAAVKSQISADYVLLDSAVLSDTTDASTKTKAGAIADNFNYSVTVQASALAFKKSDINQFVNNYISSQTPLGETLLDNSSKVDYSSSVIDISGGKATLNINISAGVYKNVDINSMELSMLGENTAQINQTINNNLGDGASKIQIKFWPFWVNSAPNNQSAVKVYLKFQ
jgi:hypothetical protein